MPDCPSLIVAEYQGPAHDPKLHAPVLNLIREIGIVDAVKAIRYFSFVKFHCVLVVYDKNTQQLAYFKFLDDKLVAEVLDPETWRTKAPTALLGSSSTLAYLEALTGGQLSNPELFKVMMPATQGSGVCDLLDLGTGELTHSVSVPYRKAMAAFKKAIVVPKDPVLHKDAPGFELKNPYQLTQGD